MTKAKTAPENIVAMMVGGLRAVHGRRSKHSRNRANQRESRPSQAPTRTGPDVGPDWSRGCENCGQTPIVPVTGMCGPCTFGEADTAGGEW